MLHATLGTSSRFGREQLDAVRQELLRVLRRKCPRWLRNDLEDIVQVAVVKIARAIERDGDVSRTYVRKAASTTLIDLMRKRRHDRQQEDEEPVIVDRSAGGNPERVTRQREVGDAIRACLEAIHERRRRAVSAYLVGYRMREIGEMNDWNTKKAENLIYRGLADLRSCLRGKGVEP